MLTYNSLTRQAKIRGMPRTKIRVILREYLQTLILREIYRTAAGRKLFFTGGTYLRLVRDYKRFSEDLAFNTKDITREEFDALMLRVSGELGRLGIESGVRSDHWGNIFSSRLTFPGIEKRYNAVSAYSKKGGITIKVETNRPKWRPGPVSEMISGYGEIFPCLCTDISALFADKIDALNKKNRARHLYDIIIMLSGKERADEKVLASLGVDKDPLVSISERVKELKKDELKRQAEALRPFLFDEEQANLIIEAHQVVPQLINKYNAG